MNKKAILIPAATAVIAGAGAFYGGMQYQLHQTPSGANGRFGNRTGGANGQRQFNGMRPISGEVIDQDDKSITIKMMDGSTKIVLFSDKTTYNKTSAGAKTDIQKGVQVTAFGTANSDGSITAQTIGVGGGMMFRGATAPTSNK